MATIKVNPDKLLSSADKCEQYLEDYEKTYKKLFDIIERNDAKLDEVTQNALQNSCGAMRGKFDEMKEFLEMAMGVIREIAIEFREENNRSGQEIQKIRI